MNEDSWVKKRREIVVGGGGGGVGRPQKTWDEVVYEAILKC